MTYRELLHKSARLFDRGKITVDEYEEMTKPLDREIERLDKIRAEIEQIKEAEWVNSKCSICGKGIEDLIESREWYENEKPNYCPFCGKKFKRSDDEE